MDGGKCVLQLRGVRPLFSSSESDIAVLEKTYMHGYEIAVKGMENIKQLFD